MCDNADAGGGPPCGGCESCMEAQRAYYDYLDIMYPEGTNEWGIRIPQAKVNWKQEGF